MVWNYTSTMTTINPINQKVAQQFSVVWNHSDFYRDYKLLANLINTAYYNFPPKKLVRFFNDFNRDLKLYFKNTSNQGKACAIIRIIDYQYRILEMNIPTEQFRTIYQFLSCLKMVMVNSHYENNALEYLDKKRNDPHFYNRCRN